jgi:chemotaxis protein MotB
MLKRKKKGHDEHIDETWLIPYADMLTLLLALFVILFAYSSVDAAKFEQVAESLRMALTGGSGIFDQPNPVPPVIPSELPPKEDENVDSSTDPPSDLKEFFLDAEDLEELLMLQRRINQYISDRNLELSLQTQLTKDGLLITILDNALFDSGSAEVKPGAIQLAREISELLVTDPPRRVEISGHTDTDPISTARFRSNWDLSAMRAINFLKILMENQELEPSLFSASAHGEFKPVDTNDTVEGKARNRRVEVLILPRIIHE